MKKRRHLLVLAALCFAGTVNAQQLLDLNQKIEEQDGREKELELPTFNLITLPQQPVYTVSVINVVSTTRDTALRREYVQMLRENWKLRSKPVNDGLDSLEKSFNTQVAFYDTLLNADTSKFSVPARRVYEQYLANLFEYILDFKKMLPGVERQRAAFQAALDSISTKNYTRTQPSEQAFAQYQEQVTLLHQLYLVYTQRINLIAKQYQLLLKPEGPAEKNKEFAVSPALTSALGTSYIAPSLDVFGSQRFGDKDKGTALYGDIRLFTSPAAIKVKSDAPGMGRGLFLQQGSAFGLVLNGTAGFRGMKNDHEKVLALNFSLSYLGKKIEVDSTTNFIAGCTHEKIGLEGMLINHKFSAYLNANFLYFTNNLENFSRYIAPSTTIYTYCDFGVRAFLKMNSNEKNDTNFLIDLDFLLNNNSLRQVVPSSDHLIPVVKISIQQEFGL